MNMKIGVKLLVGFVSVVLLMTALALYSVRISEKSLEEAVGRSSVFLAEEMLKTVNRDIYLKIEALRVHTSHFLFQKLLMESNRQFERFDNVQEWINGKEAAWVSAPRGEVTPFMESLIQNPLSDSLRNEISKYYERRYGYPVFVEIFVTNRFGAVIAETNKTLDYRQDDESWWQVARERGFSVGNVAYDESSRTYAISVGIRIVDASGNFAGVMKAVVDTKGIVREAEMATKKYETTRIQVITEDGRLIYSTRAFQFLEDLSGTRFFKKIKAGDGVFMGDLGGKKILYSYARSQGYRGFKGLGWILVVGHNVQEVLAPAFSLRNRILAVSLFLIAVAILIALFMSRSITRPVAQLIRGAGEIGKGRLDYRIPVTGKDEMGQLAAAFNDMAEQRKREEAALRESEERFRGFFSTAAIGMVMGDTDGCFVQVNGAFREIVGYDEKALMGRTFQSLVHPQDLEEELPLLNRLLNGEIPHYHREERLIHKQGHEVWINVSVSLVRDKDGRPVNLIASIENITELRQHRAHLEQMVEDRTAKLARSNQELEQFAYVASHDLQEPLRKVQAFGDRFVARYGDKVDERGRDYLARMQGAGRRMGTMIQDLLSLSRVTTKGSAFVPVDLTAEVQQVLSDLEVGIDECGGLFEIGELPIVEADPSQIRQLMQNLLSNAFKYRKEGEPPLVRIYAVMSESDGPEGEKLCRIHVEDNGIGFEQAYADRIFEPFQRLHGRSEYEGTGIGLTICRKIAERHGGSIMAKGVPGHGSTFIVTLPVKQAKEASKHG